MKISARNALKGKVKQIDQGAVNTEVTIELPGGIEIVSIVTKKSATSLGLAKGKGRVRGHQGLQRDDRG